MLGEEVQGNAGSKIMIVPMGDLKGEAHRYFDEELYSRDLWGFLVHSERDVLLAGLRPDLARRALEHVARERGAGFVLDDADALVDLIRKKAEGAASTFSVKDSYTTKFGYSTSQLSHLPTKPSAEFLSRAIARGGPANLHFRNVRGGSLGGIRAKLRLQLSTAAEDVSAAFREWVAFGRPRVTEAFRADCEWVRAPFVLTDSLPLRSDADQIRLATYETTLRGVEEHAMLSLFGSLPNVTWARILASVFEKSEAVMGRFDVQTYRQWAAAPWRHAHGVAPPNLGCPWAGCASRLLPKGAMGCQPHKPMHDDDNG